MHKQQLQTLELNSRDLCHAPVALVSLGDCNFKSVVAEAAVATVQNTDADAPWPLFWQIHPASNGLGGDLVVVKGAGVETLDIPVGDSYPRKGVRGDCHDVCGAVLSIPAAKVRLKAAPAAAPQTRLRWPPRSTADSFPSMPSRPTLAPMATGSFSQPADGQPASASRAAENLSDAAAVASRVAENLFDTAPVVEQQRDHEPSSPQRPGT